MRLAPLMTADEVTAFWAAHFPQVAKVGVIVITEIGPGSATLRLVPGEQHLRPGNTVAGPTLVFLADVTAYAALLAHVGPEPMVVTSNLNVSFLRRAAME